LTPRIAKRTPFGHLAMSMKRSETVTLRIYAVCDSCEAGHSTLFSSPPCLTPRRMPCATSRCFSAPLILRILARQTPAPLSLFVCCSSLNFVRWRLSFEVSVITILRRLISLGAARKPSWRELLQHVLGISPEVPARVHECAKPRQLKGALAIRTNLPALRLRPHGFSTAGVHATIVSSLGALSLFSRHIHHCFLAPESSSFNPSSLCRSGVCRCSLDPQFVNSPDRVQR